MQVTGKGPVVLTGAGLELTVTLMPQFPKALECQGEDLAVTPP